MYEETTNTRYSHLLEHVSGQSLGTTYHDALASGFLNAGLDFGRQGVNVSVHAAPRGEADKTLGERRSKKVRAVRPFTQNG